MSELITLRDICKKAKVEAKFARIRLRGARRGEVPRPVTKKRWVWRGAIKAKKVQQFIAA
jgi:hypothetical protein